jgi:hypothetical protein
MKEAELRKTSVHLQGVGRVHAKKMRDFKVGEKMAYNYGSTSTILKKEIKGKSAKLKIKTQEGEIYNVMKRMDTLIAIG